MSISTFASLEAKIVAPYARERFMKLAYTTVSGRLWSSWVTGLNTGTAPTTAATCSRTTAGALGQPDAGSGNVGRLARFVTKSNNRAAVWLCDRLSHQGGLSGLLTTEQTTNLPTAALPTRASSAVGVWAAIEIYSALGGSATTVTMRYTNSGGTGSRTSISTVLGGTEFTEAQRFIIMPMQAGDVGVKSVEGVTVGVSTGAAGNFGITLFKPILVGCANQILDSIERGVYDPVRQLGGALPQIQDDACLWLVHWAAATTSGIGAHELTFVKE